MVAWYISKLSDHEQIKLLKKTFWKHRYYNIWIMCVGITCGSSFALRHFLSDNWFQFKSNVSNKYLKHKLKCLHLFQCLVEAKKEDIVESAKQLFQNRQIDLSNLTLLPSDLNTLGFFLRRSINKEWDVLNLSNCNIGSNDINILCDRFLDADSRCLLTVKTINFSFNQLNFLPFKRMIDLSKYWHTTEIIITDGVMFDVTTNIAIEEVILQSSTDCESKLVLIRSLIFAKNVGQVKILNILSKTSIRIIYLLKCSWKSNN